MADTALKTRLSKQEEWSYISSNDPATMQQQSTEHILKMSLSSKRVSRFQLGETAKAWIALIPALIFLILFMIYPIINTFIISFIENFRFMKGSGGKFLPNDDCSRANIVTFLYRYNL